MTPTEEVDLKNYEQYVPTTADKEAALTAARKLIYAQPFQKVCQAYALLLIEQTKLTKEINDHRAARGFKLLPIFTK